MFSVGNLLAQKYTTRLGTMSSSTGNFSLGARQRWPARAAACRGAGRRLARSCFPTICSALGRLLLWGALNAVSLFRNKKETMAKWISSDAPLPSASLPRGDTVFGQQPNAVTHGGEASDFARFSLCSPGWIYFPLLHSGAHHQLRAPVEPAPGFSGLSTNFGSHPRCHG